VVFLYIRLMLRKLLIITCLFSTVFVAFGQGKKKNKNKETTATQVAVTDTVKINYKEIGAPMPPIKATIYLGKAAGKEIITEKDLANDANLLIMMYNPTCGHCQEETILFEKHIYLFKQTKILLLAAPTMDQYMDFFETATKVSEYPSIKVGLDNSGFIDKTFNYSGLPQINIYDKNRKLLRMFNSDTPLDSLKPYIQ
jgi:thiol-disulfide isomerase/thioredoxin